MQKRRNHFNAFMKEYEQRYFYRALNKEDMKQIVTIMTKELQKRCKEA